MASLVTTPPTGYVEQDYIVSIEYLVPNSSHPRHDWEELDEDLRALAMGMAEYGQLEPIICTPLTVRYASGAQKQLLRIVNGHRRLAAARVADLKDVWVRVVVCNDSGLPLNEFQQLDLWSTLTLSSKPLTGEQGIAAILRLCNAWELLSTPDSERRRFFTTRELAARLGVSTGTISNGMKIAKEPSLIVNAVLSRSVQSGAALVLIDLIADAERRAELVETVLNCNAARRATGQPPLTIEDIKQLAQQVSRIPDEGGHEPLEPRHVVPAAQTNGKMASDTSDAAVAVDAPPEQTGRASGRSQRVVPVSPVLPPDYAIVCLYADDPEPRPIRAAIALADDLARIGRRLTSSDRAELPELMREAVELLAGDPGIDGLAEAAATIASETAGDQPALAMPSAPEEEPAS